MYSIRCAIVLLFEHKDKYYKSLNLLFNFMGHFLLFKLEKKGEKKNCNLTFLLVTTVFMCTVFEHVMDKVK